MTFKILGISFNSRKAEDLSLQSVHVISNILHAAYLMGMEGSLPGDTLLSSAVVKKMKKSISSTPHMPS
jgi:hypothetical protein